MIQAIKNNALLIVAVLTMAFAVFALPGTVSATAAGDNIDINEGIDCGSEINFSGSGCEPEGTDRVEGTIRTIINIFSVIVGAVAVIMIVFGGFRYITSGGDSNNIGSAKNTIVFAIVGLVIVAIAQAIVQFVLEEV